MSSLVKHEERSAMIFNPLDMEQFVNLERFCRKMALTKMVPEAYRASDKVPLEEAEANIMIAYQMGQELGMSWISVLQNMDVIQGKAGWKSTYLISKINESGKFEPLEWEFGIDGKVGKLKYIEAEWNKEKGKSFPVEKDFDGTDLDNHTCYAYTRRIGSDKILKSPVVDLRMAVQESWYTKKGSKWKTMRELMMSYRTAAFWTRLHYPEGTNGRLTIEEEMDIKPEAQDITYEIVQSPEQEIKQKANSVVMSFDEPVVNTPKQDPMPEPEQEKPAEAMPENVDVTTGEVTTPPETSTRRPRNKQAFV